MKLICYTAIINGYDTLPKIRHQEANFEFICFTDTPNFIDAEPPWTIVAIPGYFRDPKVTSGFLKSNSHLLFGHDSLSLWVDANLSAVRVDSSLLAACPVSVSPHLIRRSVRDETDAVVSLRLEAAASAARHVALLDDRGFPDDRGLSATMYLGRDHRDPRVRQANAIWWEAISGGARRDQLSFDYALWTAGLSPRWLDVDWRAPNPLFTLLPHKNPATRELHVTERAEFRSLLAMPPLPSGYPAEVGFWLERPLEREADTLRQLNDVVAKTEPGGRVEGNYCHFDRAEIREWTPSDPRRSWKREFLRRAVKGHRRGLEIGFNAGHGAALMLANEPGLSLRSIDIGSHDYTAACADRLRHLFGERFDFTRGDSRTVLASIDMSTFDFVHVNGGNRGDIVEVELDAVVTGCSSGTLIVVDDAYGPHIQALIQERVAAGLLAPAPIGFVSSGENRAYLRI